MYLVLYLGAALVVGIVLGSVLGRFAIPAGLFLVALGCAPMALLWLYDTIAKPTGDPSAAGMLSTIILILVAPTGVATFFTGLFQGD